MKLFEDTKEVKMNATNWRNHMNSNSMFFIFIVPIAMAYLVISIALDKRRFKSEKTLIRGGIVFSIVVSIALKIISHLDGSGHEFSISETIGMAFVLSLVSYLYTSFINKARKKRVNSIRK